MTEDDRENQNSSQDKARLVIPPSSNQTISQLFPGNESNSQFTIKDFEMELDTLVGQTNKSQQNMQRRKSNSVTPAFAKHGDTSSSDDEDPELDSQLKKSKLNMKSQVDKLYDPFEGIDHLTKVKVQSDLGANHITPFNLVEYVQVLFNPLSKDDFQEIITVQQFNPSIRLQDKELRVGSKANDIKEMLENFRSTCPKDHKLSMGVCDEDYKQRCAFCRKVILVGDQAYTCMDECNYYICQPCNLRHYVRHNLIHQTSQHHFYTPYQLEAVQENHRRHGADEIEEQIALGGLPALGVSDKSMGMQFAESSKLSQTIKSRKEIDEKKKRLDELEARRKLAELGGNQTTTSLRFANIVKETKVYETGANDFKKYVLIGLWRHKQGKHVCYRVFKIEQPTFINLQRSGKTEQQFFHIGKNEELCFFTKEKVQGGVSNILCNFLDIRHAMSGAEDEFEQCSSMVWKAPILKCAKFEAGSKAQLLLVPLLIDQDIRVSPQDELKILTFGDDQILVINCALAYAKDTKEWVETPQPNLHFVNLTDPNKIFTIYNAQLLLNVSATKKGTPDEVLFLREKSFVQMDWESPVNETELVKEFLQNGNIPFQSTVRCYIFLPPPDNMSFSLQQDELDRTIENLSSLNSLKNGFVHSDNKRVSINYTSGGVFTFELSEKAHYSKPSKWQGEIGEIKNFNFESLTIDNFKTIKARGNDDIKGEFNVTGEIIKNKLEWKGHQHSQGTRSEFSFATFQIEENGTVHAKGTDLRGEFTITGSLDDERRKIQWALRYDSNGQQTFFEGSINQDQTKIVGLWGYSQGDCTEELEVKIGSIVGVVILIQYSGFDTWIQLKGVLDQDSAEIEGTFTCSKDLEKFLIIDKRNASKNTFYLTGHECRDRAIKLYSSTDDMQDARFCWATKDQKKFLCAVGHMRLKKINGQSIHGYKTIELDVIDLDAENLLLRKDKTKLTCQVPETFQESYDLQGHPKMPFYIFMTFKISHLGQENIRFQTQMSYHDVQQNERKIVFLSGTQKNRETDQAKLVEYWRDIMIPQGPAPMSENYTINYPILSYKSNHPMEQQIVICNLATNEPQKFVNIAPFTFVEFVKVGLNPERHLNAEAEDAANTSIFFMVELDGSLYLMNYRCFPWPINKKLIDPLESHRFQFEDQLQLLSGKIELSLFKSKINPKRLAAEQIQQAAMIQRAQTDGIQAMVVLQLVNEIIVFNLARPKYMERLQNDEVKMLKIHMQRGPDEQVYYGEESTGGLDQLVELTFVEKHRASTKVIYRSDNHKILAFSLQVNNGVVEQSNIYPLFIYVLKSNRQIYRLSNTVAKGADNEFAVDLHINLENHPGTPQLMTQLIRSIWQNILLRETDVTSLQPATTVDDQLVATVMSTKSDLVQDIEMLGFDDDRTLKMLKQNRKNFKTKPCSVASMFLVPWIGKNVFEVQEAKNNYFMIQNQLGSRRIDILRFDQDDSSKKTQLLVGNSHIAINLRSTNQYMLYDQKTFDFVRTYPAKNLFSLSNVSNGVQYFKSSRLDTDSNELDTVVKFDRHGAQTVIYQNVVSQIEQVRRQYFKNKPIEFDINMWSLQTDNENLLGVFAYSYSKDRFKPLPCKAQTNFNGETINLNCYMISQEVNKIHDQKFAEKQSLSASKSSHFNSFKGGEISNLLKRSFVDYKGVKSDTPTIFVIECDHWEQLERHQTRFTLFTREYMVIRHHMHICYAKISDIWKVNEVAQSQCTGADCLTGLGRFQELYEKNKCMIPFHFINLDVLAPGHTKNECSIIEVADYDMLIAEKGESRENAIQITFSDLAIMWDLDEQKEVTFLAKPEQFASQKDYIATGFPPHKFKTEKRLMSNCKYFTQNEDRSLVMSPDTELQNSEIMRTYAYIYLMDVLDLQKRQFENLLVSNIDENIMSQNFGGLTFFQIFRHNEGYFTLLENKIKDGEFKEQEVIDERGEVSDHILIRKIYWTMNLPVVQSEADPVAFEKVLRPSILQSTMYEEKNEHMLSSFLRLTKLSREYRLSDLVGNFECFIQVFEIQSKQIQAFLEESHIENYDCLEVKTSQWNENHTMITFGSNYSLLTADQIIEEIRKQQMKKLSTFAKLMEMIRPSKDVLTKDQKTFQVRVRIVEIEWLADNMQDLYMYLNGVSDDNMFGNEFIRILLEQQDYKWQLSLKVFLPYICLLFFNFLYFTWMVPSVPVTGGFFGVEGDRTQVAVRMIILIGCAMQGFIELRQMKKQGTSYLTDFWNFIFWGSIILCVIIVVCHGGEYLEHNTLVILSSIASIFQWGILYYWMRLYPELAFYVTMISETLKDIKDFFIIFIMCIAMFGNAVYILNLMQPEASYEEGAEAPEPNETLWDEAFREPFVDSVFNQYIIGLGEFNIGSYSDHPAVVLIYLYFILATLFTQIMFLNMLIAIMGQTFTRVSEAKERTALMERTHLYADFMWGISLSKDLTGKRYLYVVKPDDQDEEDQGNAIQAAQSKITELMKNYNTKNDVEIEYLQSKVNLVLQSHYQMKVEMKEQMDQIQTDIKTRFDQLMSKLQK